MARLPYGFMNDVSFSRQMLFNKKKIRQYHFAMLKMQHSRVIWSLCAFVWKWHSFQFHTHENHYRCATLLAMLIFCKKKSRHFHNLRLFIYLFIVQCNKYIFKLPQNQNGILTMTMVQGKTKQKRVHETKSPNAIIFFLRYFNYMYQNVCINHHWICIAIADQYDIVKQIDRFLNKSIRIKRVGRHNKKLKPKEK